MLLNFSRNLTAKILVLESFPMRWSTLTYALQRYAETVGSICGTQKAVALNNQSYKVLNVFTDITEKRDK